MSKGLTKEKIIEVSNLKNEPSWMLELRLKSYEHFLSRSLPSFGPSLEELNFENINYYVKPDTEQVDRWESLPNEIKDTYNKLGIPEAEQKYLSGVKAQFESEVVYGSLLKKLDDQGVIFTDTDTALQKYPEIFQKYFGTVIPYSDNKFASLNTAIWSGGSFLYIPKNVKVELPLQAYFRIQSENMGQFERTLIIADEGSELHYIEGCSAPMYSSDSLHSAVVEIICMKDSKVRYTTIQNWSKNVYNLVTKRAFVYENARMSWVDGNLGSKITMKYPSCVLLGTKAHGEVLSLAMAGSLNKNINDKAIQSGQIIDSGAKMIHAAPHTSSIITSKSVCFDGGRTSYRGLIRVNKNAENCKIKVNCDALILDEISQTDTYPTMKVDNNHVNIQHEATSGKLDEDKIYYLKSKGLSAQDSNNLIIAGFLDEITKELPMEYAVELNRLISMSMEGSVG